MSLSDIRDKSENATPPAPITPEITGAEKVLHIQFELQGQTLSASVVSSILSFDQTLKRDRALVQMAAPERYDDLPAMAKLRIYALATLSQALKNPPPWLDEWLGRFDPLLFAVYEEVSAHERAFFRVGMEASEEDEGSTPLVKIRSLTPPTP